MPPSLRAALALAGIVAVYVALYAPARRFDYVWADRDAIRDSAVYDLPLAQQLRTTEHARMDPSLMALHGIELMHESYRPLLIWTHALDRRWFGRAAPGAMHVHSLIYGGLAILAAFWLSLRVLGRATPALLVTAIFAWHPLHVEPNCFLSARGDPLSGLLGLMAAALVAELLPRPQFEPPFETRARGRVACWALSLAAGVALLLSLFAKEANLLLPLALAALALATGRQRAWAPGLAAVAAAVPAYAGLRAVLVPHAPAATHGSQVTRAVASLPAIVLEYARTFELPFDISIARSFDVSPLLGWSVLVAAVALTVWVLRGGPATWRPAIALAAAGVAWAGLTIATAAVAVFSEGAVADRYAYLGVFGFALALVALGARVAALSPHLRRIVTVAAALFLGLLVFVTASEVPAWADDGALYQHAVEVEPASGVAHARLGRWRGERGDWAGAAAELERAVTFPGGSGDRTLNNLGVAYLNLGRWPQAESTLRQAIARSGETSFHGWYNLGSVQRLRGDLLAACASYRRALALNSAYARAQADLVRYCPAR
jgi:tetratricopeptide (TPR) repeat protein